AHPKPNVDRSLLLQTCPLPYRLPQPTPPQGPRRAVSIAVASADAIDNHRSFHDKHGLAGKRELQPEDEARPGSYDRPLPENNVVRTIIEFLNFLHLKEAGALERLPDLLPVASTEDTEQA
uniref:Galanin peptides n=1 Tax=Equus caballus TaxID=9796 RepID=A0A9L0TG74_HORSE